MPVNNLPRFNKKIVFAAVATLIIIATAAILWLFAVSEKGAPETKEEISAPRSEAEKVDEFAEFPEAVRPLFQDSLDEAISDIEELEQ
ncbi:MAG: hypothetical protein WAP23_01700 [Candidatus Spechtbacterales bacterium]